MDTQPFRCTRRGFLRYASLAALSGAGVDSLAQTGPRGFPNRPVRIIVPYPAGGPSDTMARTIAAILSPRLHQPIVVENKAGASAVIGSEAVAKASPDGYTLLLANVGEIAIVPAIQAGLPYDPVRDFAPVTHAVSGPLVLLVRNDLPAKTVQELIALAKAQPGKLTFGSTGAGGIIHLAGEMLCSTAGIKMLHVPYKGVSPMVTDLLGGQIDMAFVGISGATPLIQGSKARGLAVTSLSRAKRLPDLPAIAELYAGFEANSWLSIMAPGGTPPDIVNYLHEELAAALKQPETTELLESRGLVVEAAPPDQFARRIKTDLARWAEVARAAGLKPG